MNRDQFSVASLLLYICGFTSFHLQPVSCMSNESQVSASSAPKTSKRDEEVEEEAEENFQLR